MRTIFIVLLCLPLFTLAQTAEKKSETSQSKVETFSLKTGSLIKKEFVDIETIKKVQIQNLTITDLLTKTEVKGIKLETSVYKSYGSATKSCFLDADEIDGFIKSGRLLLQELATSKTDNYIEYQFTSRDGFQSGAYINEKKEWKYFLRLDKYDSDTYVWLVRDDFERIVNAIENAKSKL